MWLLTVICLIFNVAICAFSDIPENENTVLKYSLFESIRADPELEGLQYESLSQKSKSFIDEKIEIFIQLLSPSQHISRVKRSLKVEGIEKKLASINIFPLERIPAETSQDIRFIKDRKETSLVAVLENGGYLSIYEYHPHESSLQRIPRTNQKYSTNIATATLSSSSLIVLGDANFIHVFEYIFHNHTLNEIQKIRAIRPKHVVLWEQDNSPFLSITQVAVVQIYQWLGRHFDHVQNITLADVKKTVPFNIHGSHYLGVVNDGQYQNEKSYSPILRFNPHSGMFEIYQRLLTEGCSDIKYFASQLHGEDHYFLVVAQSLAKFRDSNYNYSSIIYKYEDSYFIPFQTIRTNAVLWQPIQDFHGNAALMALTENGIEGFQYDGWHFSESEIASNGIDIKMQNVKALHTFNFNGKQVLIIISDISHQIYLVNFTSTNALREVHTEILLWCENTLKTLSPINDAVIARESLRGDINEEISLAQEPQSQTSASLTQNNVTRLTLETPNNFNFFALEQALMRLENLIIGHNIKASEVIFKDTLSVDSINTESFNELPIDSLLDNVVNIIEGFNIYKGLMECECIEITNISLFQMNNKPLEDYINVSSDLTLENLTIHGNATFSGELNVKERINTKIQISQDFVLLSEGDQTFEGNVRFNELILDHLTANFTPKPPSFKEEISHIKHLNVNHLKIGGLINNVYLPVLAEKSLKKAGDQVLEEPFIVRKLNVTDFNLGGTLGGKKVPSDFILINSNASYSINQDVNFLADLYVNNLQVEHSLNNITVTKDGELPILLTDSPKVQYVPSKKRFENLFINDLIYRQNAINEENLQQFNPLILDNQNHSFKGDVTLNGNVQVLSRLKARNLRHFNNTQRSFVDVLERGLKLTEGEIPLHLTFLETLNLDGLKVSQINHMNPANWLQISANSSQFISGEKTFLGNLYLGGRVNMSEINKVNVKQLESVLRINGDQEISGLLEAEKIVALNGIRSSNNVERASAEETLIINGSLTLNTLNASSLTLVGLINRRNISDIISNLVKTHNSPLFTVFGEKSFTELHVENLIIPPESSEILSLLQDVINGQITINSSLDLLKNISINDIKFAKNFNNISKEDFDSLMGLTPNEDILVIPDMQYDQIEVLGDVFITDDHINGQNLTYLEKESVKTDEDHSFDKAVFQDDVVVERSIKLKGNIENLDLENVVLHSLNKVIPIKDKEFKDMLYVEGSLRINKKVSGIDFDKLCKHLMPSDELKSLRIEGDVIFTKGPKIQSIDNLLVQDLKKSLWFVDQPATLSGGLIVKNATFGSSVFVKEFVDTVRLNILSKNYLSKSKPQTIPASFTFQNVTFSNITTPKLTTTKLNGIVIDDLLKLLLLQNVSQSFEIPPHFEEVLVKDLNNDVLVRGLNLTCDVMRYDKFNIVTGAKSFSNLKVETLGLPDNIKIQDVDVVDWLNNAVLTNGWFNVKGKKAFKNATFDGYLSVRKKLNNREFTNSSVMLTNVPQTITGKKTFITRDSEPTKIINLNVKGLINEIAFEELIRDQAYKQQNSVLHSDIVFSGNVSIDNLIIDNLYNNVNMTDLIRNVSKLRNLEGLEAKFANLLNMGEILERSLKDQSVLFKYYKEVISIENAYDVFSLRGKDDVYRILSFSLENQSNVFKSFEWDVYRESFVLAGEKMDLLGPKPNFLQQISFENEDYLYMERPDKSFADRRSSVSEPIKSGRLMRLESPTSFKIVAEFYRNGTVSLTSFSHPQTKQPCLVFVGYTLTSVDIYCLESNHSMFYWAQRIPMVEVFKVAALEISGSVYLFSVIKGMVLDESQVVVFKSKIGLSLEFSLVATIVENGQINDVSCAIIDGLPYVALSVRSQESAVKSGSISIHRLYTESNKLARWQYIPIENPLGVQLITPNSFAPLLIIPSSKRSAPLNIFSYDGVAGFRRILKGSALPVSSKVRVMANGHFLGLVQANQEIASVLAAVVQSKKL
ncbi:uncharacterized protein clos [Euwallacea fornicatus]|uniref:uncharacterized protein clos n=1 Tax=Euwallacea fornicatus TaxID=995702 RepID=UPI00338EA782